MSDFLFIITGLILPIVAVFALFSSLRLLVNAGSVRLWIEFVLGNITLFMFFPLGVFIIACVVLEAWKVAADTSMTVVERDERDANDRKILREIESELRSAAR